MKTIEERAHSFACLNDKPSSFFSDLEKGYLAGASEQKAIDEEVRLKKCDDMTEAEYNRETAFADWYHKNEKGTPTYSDAIEWARKDLLDKACKWIKENTECGVHPQSAYGFADRFIKAMEK